MYFFPQIKSKLASIWIIVYSKKNTGKWYIMNDICHSQQYFSYILEVGCFPFCDWKHRDEIYGLPRALHDRWWLCSATTAFTLDCLCRQKFNYHTTAVIATLINIVLEVHNRIPTSKCKLIPFNQRDLDTIIKTKHGFTEILYDFKSEFCT